MDITQSLQGQSAASLEETRSKLPFNLLILVVLGVDLFTPFLIWKGIVPANLRWLSHGGIALMIFGSYLRMMAFRRIPRGVWFILGVSALWVLVGIFQGQGVLPTIWGWWILFQFPFIGLFSYLQPAWPAHFPRVLRTLCFGILVLELFVQIIQYLTGTPPGDQLAGTLGQNGTGTLVIFLFIVVCLYLGYWLNKKRRIELVLVLGMSLISSVLGEMKLFLVGMLFIGLLALLIYGFINRSFFRTLGYAILVFSVLAVFVYLYNIIVPGANTYSIQSYITNPAELVKYLNRADRMTVNGITYTNMGRNFALGYGWKTIQQDPITFLFGLGLGARGESLTLGTKGVGIARGNLGQSSGTSLLVMMQEQGVIGLLVLAAFITWVILRLILDIRKNPQSEAVELRYALLLFTVFWPLWIWYNSAWTLRVPMVLYWLTIGYTFAEANGFHTTVLSRSILSREG